MSRRGFSSGNTWDDVPALLGRIERLLCELRYINEACDFLGPPLIYGMDPLVAGEVRLGWTYPFPYNYTMPWAGFQREETHRRLEQILDVATVWARAQMEEFAQGLQTLAEPNLDALSQAAIALAEAGDELGGSLDTDLSMLNASLSHWYGDAKDSFVDFAGGLSTAREQQAELAATASIATAGAVVTIQQARDSIGALLTATERSLDLQLQARANASTQANVETLQILSPVLGVLSSLLALIPVYGTIASSVTGIMGAAAGLAQDTETADVAFVRATEAAEQLHTVRERILENRDNQFETTRAETVTRMQRVLTAGGYALLSPPRPELADHPVDADAFHHSSSESY